MGQKGMCFPKELSLLVIDTNMSTCITNMVYVFFETMREVKTTVNELSNYNRVTHY